MKYVFLLFLTIFMSSVFAQKRVKIDDVIVNGKRTLSNSGTTRTSIDSAALANAKNGSFAELLSINTPIFIKSYGLGSQATVSFRGTAASHTQVEWNGVNINNPMLGQVDFSMIPVWFIDKVDILHGGSSLGEGSGALGGTVQMGSVPRWDEKFYGSLMQGVGSFGNYQTFARVGGGNKRIQAKIGMMYEQAKNDFEFFNNGILPNKYQSQTNADYRKWGGVADVYANLGKNHYLSAHGWYHTAKRNLPTIMSYEGKGRTEWQDEDEARAVVKWRWFGKRVSSELTSGFSDTSLDYLLANKSDLGEFTNIDARSSVLSFYNKYKLNFFISDRNLLKFSADFNYHSVKTLNHITREGYKNSREEFGASVSYHRVINEKISGFVLTRVENNGTFMPSVGFDYEPLENLIFKTNATRNYHRPTLNDLYWLPGGNPDLRAERGYTVDLSSEYTLRKTTVGVTGFGSWIDDWIIWQPSEFRYWRAFNMKKVFSRGVEVKFSTEQTFGKWKFTLGGNYGFTKTTNQEPQQEGDASVGKQLIYIPVHKANMRLDVAHRGFYLTYSWAYTGERFTNSDNSSTMHDLPAYDLHNVTLGKSFKGFDIEVKVDNLLGKDYQAILWRAMPKRNFSLILKYTF